MWRNELGCVGMPPTNGWRVATPLTTVNGIATPQSVMSPMVAALEFSPGLAWLSIRFVWRAGGRGDDPARAERHRGSAGRSLLRAVWWGRSAAIWRPTARTPAHKAVKRGPRKRPGLDSSRADAGWCVAARLCDAADCPGAFVSYNNRVNVLHK